MHEFTDLDCYSSTSHFNLMFYPAPPKAFTDESREKPNSLSIGGQGMVGIPEVFR